MGPAFSSDRPFLCHNTPSFQNDRKNRVQPANSLQAKCSVSWVMTGGELVAVPIFPSCTTFATGCYALAGSLAGGVLVSYPPICRTMPYCFRPA